MKDIIDYVGSLELGTIQRHKNMKVIPLYGKESGLEYMVFENALNSGLQIRETGSVPTLHFSNKTGKDTLILQGEYVLGGKQNRMVAQNVYMAKDFDGDVPVRCVQRGRWSYEGQPDFPQMPQLPNPGPIPRPPIGFPQPGDPWPGMTPRPCEPRLGTGQQFRSSGKMATLSMKEFSSDQTAVWHEIADMAASYGVRSATSNIGDIYQGKQKDIDEFISHFKQAKGAVGFAVGIEKDGTTRYAVDLFDKTQTQEHYFKRLLESYALDALKDSGNAKRLKKDLKELLYSLHSAQYTPAKAISVGTNYAIAAEGISGSALLCGHTPVYINLSNSDISKCGPGAQPIAMDGLVYDGIRTGFFR